VTGLGCYPAPDSLLTFRDARLTGQRLDAGRARFDAQHFGGTLDPPRDLAVKLAKLP
jgi:hypothetical protein